jgi:DNA-binding GntR family transcriptional regulator
VEVALLRDDIYRVLKRAILNSEYQPGQELRVQLLAGRYRVSRSPVRDALLRLEQENLVRVRPRQGYQVTAVSGPDALLGLHRVIDPACAEAAAQADDAALRSLDKFRGGRNTAEGQPSFTEYNSSFHCAVAVLSGNHRMATIACFLAEQFQRLVGTGDAFDQTHMVDEAAEHDAIIDAIQAHEGALAAKLCYDHTLRAYARLAAD